MTIVISILNKSSDGFYSDGASLSLSALPNCYSLSLLNFHFQILQACWLGLEDLTCIASGGQQVGETQRSFSQMAFGLSWVFSLKTFHSEPKKLLRWDAKCFHSKKKKKVWLPYGKNTLGTNMSWVIEKLHRQVRKSYFSGLGQRRGRLDQKLGPGRELRSLLLFLCRDWWDGVALQSLWRHCFRLPLWGSCLWRM